MLSLPVLLVYATILWLSFLGMVAFAADSVWTWRAKVLGATTFVVLVIDAVRHLPY